MIPEVTAPPWPPGPMVLRLDALEEITLGDLGALERRGDVCVGAVGEGQCEGGALAAALAVDLLVAAPTVAFGRPGRWRDPVIRRGVGILGRKATAYLVMTKRSIRAERARRWGLVTAVDENPVATARRLAEAISRRSSVAVSTILRQAHRGAAGDYVGSRITAAEDEGRLD